MKRTRIYWPNGNPRFDAWAVESQAGNLVIRHNHAAISKGSQHCQGWDIWLNGKYLGAVGSRSFTELVQLSRRQLKSVALSACCGRHEKFIAGKALKPRPGWGGPRANAGRPPKGKTKRVKFSTTLDRHSVEIIDQRRGDVSRGEYLDRLLQTLRKQ